MESSKAEITAANPAEPPTWTPDDSSEFCVKCNSAFSLLNRRHHCRNCGGLFCGNCTNKSISIVKFRYDTPVRVCDECFAVVEKETFPVLDSDLGKNRPGVVLQSVAVGERRENEGTPRRVPIAAQSLIMQWDTSIKTLVDAMRVVVQSGPSRPCLGVRKQGADGKTWLPEFAWWNYAEIDKRRVNLGSGIAALGHQPDDAIGIYSINRPEWVLTDLACQLFRWPSIALYDTLGKDAVEFVINHAAIKLVVVASKQLTTFLSVAKNCKTLKTVICMDEATPEQIKAAEEAGVKLVRFTDVEADGAKNPQQPPPVAPSDIYTIMYTSGTTGNPKGVLLTHANFIAEMTGVRYHLTGEQGFNADDRHLSYLPLAHSFERAVVYTILSFGGHVGFFHGVIPELFDDIATLKPTFLVGAPRVWSRLHDKVEATVNKTGGWRKSLFEWGFWWKKTTLAVGGSTPIVDKLVFGKTKGSLGGNVKFILSGSAPLDPQLAEWLKIVFCCTVLEGYGLTENLAGAMVTEMNENKFGRVGKPLVCVEVKLVDVPDMKYSSKNNPPTGEVCLRGGNVFKGYYKDDEKTKEVLESDGWFHTGDVGRWNEDGTLSIIDRKKNIFKLAQGEYVAVEYLEGVYKRSSLVAQVWVYGNSFERYLVAVIVPDWEVLGPQLQALGYTVANNQKALCQDKRVVELVHKDLLDTAKKAKLHGFEFVKAIRLTDDAFSTDNDLLTPTFKLKRPQLLERYKAEIDTMYSEINKAEDKSGDK